MDEVHYRRDLWRLLPLSMLPGTQTITQTVAGNVVEIGVAEGNFSFDMLKWPVHIPRLYMVDRWRSVNVKGDSSMPQSWHDGNYLQVMRKIDEFDYHDRVMVLRGESTHVACRVPPRSLALVYVDGDHSFKGVTDDIHAWTSKLMIDGVMAFHDYENEAYGVRRAVQLFCNEHKIEIHRIREDKWEDAGAWFRLPLRLYEELNANPV